MRTFVASVVVALGIATTASAQISIVFETPAFQNGVQSDGTSSLAGFTFELGTFNSFVPSLANLDQWNANFVPVASTSWHDDFGYFNDVATLTAPGDIGVLSDDAFVWGYNSKSFVSGSEWVLIDVGQQFPSSIPDTSTVGPTWTIKAPTSIALLGHLGFPDDAIFIQTTAVPEPATYAALMGLITLGIVGYRRFRRR